MCQLLVIVHIPNHSNCVFISGENHQGLKHEATWGGMFVIWIYLFVIISHFDCSNKASNWFALYWWMKWHKHSLSLMQGYVLVFFCEIVNNCTDFFYSQILAMIEEAAGTRMYECKKISAQKTIEKKDAKLKEIQTVRTFISYYFFI